MMYGMQSASFLATHELVPDYPSKVASMLKSGEVDVALVPVALLPELPHYHIVSDYCIASDVEVASVCLFSEVPVEEVTTVYLDYQSRTSVNLARILLKEYWKKDVEIEHAQEDYRHRIKGTTAAVVIGDRALAQHQVSPYYYDLSLAWQQYTGLPFVFAAWVANKPIPTEFMEAFDKANAYGLSHLEEVIAGIPIAEQVYDLHKYYTENISYELTPEKKEWMQLFLE